MKDSSRNRLKLRDEISSTSFLLYSLQGRTRDAEDLQLDENKRQWLSSTSSLGASNVPLARFNSLLEDLTARLSPAEGRHKIRKACFILMNISWSLIISLTVVTCLVYTGRDQERG